MIDIINLSKSFKDTFVFEGLDLHIDKCGIYIIEGPSGSGKSTLLNLLMGFEKADQGEIKLGSSPVMIFQNYELFDELNVKDNILLGRDDRALDHELVNYLGMEEYLDRRVLELSGGQRQRVGILRSLYKKPGIILCDEPTESLDIKNKILVMDLLKNLAKEAIVIVVTHDHELASQYGDYFYKIEGHKLKLIASKDTKKYIDHQASAYSLKDTSRIYHKLFLKRDFSFYLFHGVLLIILGVLILMASIWLTPPDSKNATNANYLYIEIIDTYNYNEDIYKLKKYDFRNVFSFRSVFYRDRYYDIDVYPHPVYETGLYLNQNSQMALNAKIGDTLIIYYVVDGKEFPYEVEVSGFVEDENLNEPIIYYGLGDFEEYLDTIEYDDNGHKYDEIVSQYVYLQDEPGLIEYQIDFKDQEELFEKSLADNSIIMHAPPLEERLEFINDTAVYHNIYLFMEIGLFVAIIILHFIYLNRSLKKAKDNFAILVSQGMDLKHLRSKYALSKILMFITSTVLSLAIISSLYCSLDKDIGELQIALIVLSSYLLLAIIVIIINTRLIKIKNMALVLKDRFD